MSGEIFSGVAYLVAVDVVERGEPVAQQKPEVVCALVEWADGVKRLEDRVAAMDIGQKIVALCAEEQLLYPRFVGAVTSARRHNQDGEYQD